MKSITLKENTIYIVFPKQKFSSKVIRLIGILLSNSLIDLLSTTGGLDQHIQYRAFWNKINLFVKAFSVGLFLFREALAIRNG